MDSTCVATPPFRRMSSRLNPAHEDTARINSTDENLNNTSEISSTESAIISSTRPARIRRQPAYLTAEMFELKPPTHRRSAARQQSPGAFDKNPTSLSTKRAPSPPTPFASGMPGEVDGDDEEQGIPNTVQFTTHQPRTRFQHRLAAAQVTTASPYQVKSVILNRTQPVGSAATNQLPTQKRSESVSSDESSWSVDNHITSNKNEKSGQKRSLRRRNSQGRVAGSRTYWQTEQARYNPSWPIPKRRRGVPVVTDADYDSIAKSARLDRPSLHNPRAKIYANNNNDNDDCTLAVKPPPHGEYSSCFMGDYDGTALARQALDLVDSSSGNLHSQQPQLIETQQALQEKAHIDMIHRDILQRNISTKWSDIAGLKQSKQALQEACVLPFFFPKYFVKIRRPWKGVLLYGPPGVGKTMLAKAVAHECRTTFFNVSLATILSQWVGESEKLVRVLFEMARRYAPATIFIDEFDSIFSKRGSSDEHEAARRIRAEFLVQMDGLESSDEEDRPGRHVIVIAATNSPWELEDAIRRRLEKAIYIPLPELEARQRVFQICMDGIELGKDVDFHALALQLDGFSGADIRIICRNAALSAMRQRVEGLTLADIAKLPKRGLDKPVTQADFQRVIATSFPTVSDEAVAKYAEWTQKNAFL